MKKGLTELVFVLDMSGSMSGLTQDTIGGFNSLIEKQKKEEGEAIVTLAVFNNEVYSIFDRIPIKDVKKLTEKDYCPQGCTALLDAVGFTINHIDAKHLELKDECLPEKVMMLIATGGMETKIQAAEKVTEYGIDMLLANGGKENALASLYDDAATGTLFLS